MPRAPGGPGLEDGCGRRAGPDRARKARGARQSGGRAGGLPERARRRAGRLSVLGGAPCPRSARRRPAGRAARALRARGRRPWRSAAGPGRGCPGSSGRGWRGDPIAGELRRRPGAARPPSCCRCGCRGCGCRGYGQGPFWVPCRRRLCRAFFMGRPAAAPHARRQARREMPVQVPLRGRGQLPRMQADARRRPGQAVPALRAHLARARPPLAAATFLRQAP